MYNIFNMVIELHTYAVIMYCTF